MLALRSESTRAIVVVDECPLDLHRKLEPIATAPDSRLSLLTLDFDPTSDPRSSASKFYRLEPFDQDHMAELLRQSHAHIPEAHLSRVADFAQGFPRMAELMVRALENGQTHLWDLAPTDTVEKLVVRRMKEPARVLRIARALSVLEHLGIDGVAEHEFKIFAEHLCGEAPHYAYSVIRELANAGIAYRRGDYIRVTPLPIAVALAGQWWDGCLPDRARQLLLGDVLTPEMADATANQLKRLAGHAWVRHLVADLYGHKSPFRQRDLLDSARGSRLASSLVEANPRAVCNALTHVFACMTPAEARTVREGRRDLVWCLEKLAWWPDTFEEAAWILLLFAAGENETWGNNATNQFCDLFHVYLSGTETPAGTRLGVLRRAITAQDAELDGVVIKALGEALESDHFSRMGGVDAQGGRLPREDWEPKTRGDIWSYWREVLSLLQPFLHSDHPLSRTARVEVANRTRGMILWGAINLIEETIKTIRCERSWPEMLDALRTALNYDGSEYPEEIRKRVEQLIDELTPIDLSSRLAATVSTPSWDELREEPDGKIVRVAVERAEALGHEVSRALPELMPLLPTLLRGEQRQGFSFARALGGSVEDPLALLRDAVDILAQIPERERNPVVATGLAVAAVMRAPSNTRDFVRSLFEQPVLRGTAVDLLRAISATDDDVALIVEHLRAKHLPSATAHGFSFGGALMPLEPATVANLIAACAEADEKGPLYALELLGMRSHGAPLDGELLPAARQLLLRPGLLAQIRMGRGDWGENHFEKLAREYLKQTGDQDFASLLNTRIVESLESKGGFRSGMGVRKLLVYLLTDHVEATWPVLRSGLEAAKGRLMLRLELVRDDLDLVSLVGEGRLLDWCNDFEEARHWVARFTPPLRDKVAGAQFPSWTPFALALLKRYGSDPDVRSSLSASIYSGGWVGSMVPRLTRHREAFMELTRHPTPDVARWAIEAVANLDANIERERKRDEEQEFGIF